MEQFIKKITKQAGKITLKKFGKIGAKYTKEWALDVVTEADLLSNEFLISSIKKKYPDHGIISEETGEYKAEADYKWIIDPIDGTLNFSKSIPLYVILVAVAYKGKVVMSVIYNPVMDELYFAKKGKGAFKNGKRIFCSPQKTLANSAGCTSNNINPKNVHFLSYLVSYLKNGKCWASSYASIGLTAAYTAEGRKDWCVSPSGNIWDYAAGSLIAQESGSTVTNLKGEPWKLGDNNMVIANKKLHKELIKVVKASKVNA